MKLKTLILATTVIFFTAASAAALDFRTDNPINFHSDINLENTDLKFQGSNQRIEGPNLLQFSDEDEDGINPSIKVNSGRLSIESDNESLVIPEQGKARISDGLNLTGDNITSIGRLNYDVQEEKHKNLNNCGPSLGYGTPSCVNRALEAFENESRAFDYYNYLTSLYMFQNDISTMEEMSETISLNSVKILPSGDIVVPEGTGLKDPSGGPVDVRDGLSVDGEINASGNSITNLNNINFDSGESITIGRNLSSDDSETIALGKDTRAESINSLAIGNGAVSGGRGGLAVGYSTNASKKWSNAIGHNSWAKRYAIAVGLDAYAEENSVALGMYSNASKSSSVAIGPGAVSKKKGLTVFDSDEDLDRVRENKMDVKVTGKTTVGEALELQASSLGTCNSNSVGQLRRKSSDDELYYCDGSSWEQISP